MRRVEIKDQVSQFQTLSLSGNFLRTFDSKVSIHDWTERARDQGKGLESDKKQGSLMQF